MSPGKAAVSWKPSRDIKLGSRLPTRVRPLFELCADVLVEYIEDVESLLGLPDSIKVRSGVHTMHICCTLILNIGRVCKPAFAAHNKAKHALVNELYTVVSMQVVSAARFAAGCC